MGNLHCDVIVLDSVNSLTGNFSLHYTHQTLLSVLFLHHQGSSSASSAFGVPDQVLECTVVLFPVKTLGPEASVLQFLIQLFFGNLFNFSPILEIAFIAPIFISPSLSIFFAHNSMN